MKDVYREPNQAEEGVSYETQMSDAEIIDLKNRLTVDDRSRRVLDAVATNIALERVDPAAFATTKEYATEVGMISAHWAVGLTKIVDLPGAEWPKYTLFPPEFYLDKVNAVESMYKGSDD